MIKHPGRALASAGLCLALAACAGPEGRAVMVCVGVCGQFPQDSSTTTETKSETAGSTLVREGFKFWTKRNADKTTEPVK